jgi:CBS domain-containing protein/ribosome-associated translation inhibitor RaiA
VSARPIFSILFIGVRDYFPVGVPSRDLVVPLSPLKLDDTLSLAAEVMWRLEVPAVPVVDERGAYAGCLSIFSLLRRRAPASTKVRSLVERVSPLETLSDPVAVARAFVKTGYPGLPVVEGGKPVGVVSARRLIQSMGLKPRVPAGLLMYKLEPLSPDDPVERARKVSADVGLRLVPVAQQGKLLGVVRVYDLARYVYVTPIQRGTRGEVSGDVEYYLSRPLRDLVVDAQRVVESGSVPTTLDLAEGCVVVGERGEVLGVISPYLLLRRLLPAVEEAAVPLRVEGVEELDFISQRLIYAKSLEIAKSVAERARLLEMSVVLKSRRKGTAARFEAYASIKLDVGVHAAKAEAWNPVEAAMEAVDAAYKRFTKAKEKARERRLSIERLRRKLLP